jgi:hypothetical protein
VENGVFQVTLRKIMEVIKIWKQMIKCKECIQPQNLLVAVGSRQRRMKVKFHAMTTMFVIIYRK